MKFSTASINGCGRGWSLTDCDFIIELPVVDTDVLRLAPEAAPLWLVVAEVGTPAVDKDVPPRPVCGAVVLFEGVKLGTY